MDQAQYLSIRKKLNLKHQASASVTYLLQNIFLISLIILCSFEFENFFARLVAIPLISVFMFRNFSMMHEAVHRAISRKPLINDLFGLLTGVFSLLPYEPWKRSHLEHHSWSGNVEKDPVMALIRLYPQMPVATQKTLSFFWNIWLPMLACMQHIVFWSLSFKIYWKNPRSLKLSASMFLPVLFWVALFLVCPTSFTFSILIPAVFLYLVAVEVVNLPHHLKLPQYRGDTKLKVWEQHEVARSCVYPKWFARAVVLNFNYHIEHHLFPDIPWYHLEKLHVEVKAALKEKYNTDPYLHWILDNKPLPIGQILIASDSSAVANHVA